MNRQLSLFLMVFMVAVTALQAQNATSINARDLSKVEVDNLSNEQVQQFVDRASSSGISQSQLEVMARQRGMSAIQISKLRNRINQLQSTTSSKSLNDADRQRDNFQSEESFDFFGELNTRNQAPQKESRIFGSKIFTNSAMAFVPSQNVATPENYVLGPGDEVIIDIYGASETTYQEQISPDGKIFISGVGPISLTGIAIETAKKRIFNKLSSIYSGLRRPNPNTFLEVSVGSVRTIKVDVVGEAMQPGSYALSSFSTAFNALYAAGGPNNNGSMRQVDVVRNGKKIASLDVYNYYFKGDITNNPRLKDEDVLVVKSNLNRVELTGEIKNEGFFEFVTNETVADLLDFAGGFTSNAYKQNVTIDGYEGIKKSIRTIGQSDFESELVKDGDKISISKAIDRYVNRVQIEGAVYKPGVFELTEGITLIQLIENAAGLREDVYKGRGNILRQNDDLSLSNITFDINELIKGEIDIQLKNEDVVRIPSIADIETPEIIKLSGEVRNPGDYAYADSLTVEDLINLAGGLKKTASASKVEVARRVEKLAEGNLSSEVFEFSINDQLLIGDAASNFLLKPYDVVLVKATANYRVQKLVTIEGEVQYPGVYALQTENDKITDLIKRAGGQTPFAYTQGATLIRNDQLDNDETTRTNIAHQYRRTLFKDRVAQDSIDESILDTRFGIGIELDKALKNPESRYNFILQDGDLISVPKQLETVKVNGEVFYATTVKHSASYRFKKYINLAGGFNPEAKKSKSYVVYANGRAAKTTNILGFKFYPKVRPGSDIIIPKRPERRKISPGEVMGITSGLAALSLVIVQIVSISQ